MIKVKTAVRPKNLIIAAACANAAEEMGITVIITSGNDSKHMRGSKHYDGNALDIRSKNLDENIKPVFLKNVLRRLGSSYEGFLENDGMHNEHYHFEFDPKTSES